jgi:hypothetical protein
MIAEPGRDWIAWFATARWNAGVNEASTARSICFGSFVRKVSLFAREASEGCHLHDPRSDASRSVKALPATGLDAVMGSAPSQG